MSNIKQLNMAAGENEVSIHRSENGACFKVSNILLMWLKQFYVKNDFLYDWTQILYIVNDSFSLIKTLFLKAFFFFISILIFC